MWPGGLSMSALRGATGSPGVAAGLKPERSAWPRPWATASSRIPCKRMCEADVKG